MKKLKSMIGSVVWAELNFMRDKVRPFVVLATKGHNIIGLPGSSLTQKKCRPTHINLRLSKKTIVVTNFPVSIHKHKIQQRILGPLSPDEINNIIMSMMLDMIEVQKLKTGHFGKIARYNNGQFGVVLSHADDNRVIIPESTNGKFKCQFKKEHIMLDLMNPIGLNKNDIEITNVKLPSVTLNRMTIEFFKQFNPMYYK